jgi:Tol biopolymer transport system component
VSPDGTKVAFESAAPVLLSPSVYLPYGQVFVRDRTSGTTSLVSVSPTGASGNGESKGPVFSPVGNRVMFTSSSTNLGPIHSIDQGNLSLTDIYVRDLDTGSVSQVSINAAGTDGGFGIQPSFSPDGTKVVFASWGDDLVTNDSNGQRDVFVRDLAAGTTTLVSVNAAGTGSGDDDTAVDPAPRFNADGTKVVFTSWADDLVRTDTRTCEGVFGERRSCADIFVRDLRSRTTTLVSANAAKTDSGNNDSVMPVFTPDGKVIFSSVASNLGPTDTNGSSGGWDIYIAATKSGST